MRRLPIPLVLICVSRNGNLNNTETARKQNRNTMKKCLAMMIVLLAGCGSIGEESRKKLELEQQRKMDQVKLEKIQAKLKASGEFSDEDAEFLSRRFSQELYVVGDLKTITDRQAEILSKIKSIRLNGLNSLTDAQAESLGKVDGLYLDGLTTINDQQAESLSQVKILNLSGLTSITDKQVKSLSNVRTLNLNRLKSITDAQAEELSKVFWLELKGVESINESQAESLSKVKYLYVIRPCLEMVNQYKSP